MSSISNSSIAVLASGNGSNLQAIMDAIEARRLNTRIATVVSDNPSAMALKRAKQRNIPTSIVIRDHQETSEAYSARLLTTILPYSPQLVCLAGFMRLISNPLLSEYSGRIINIHPSLLPDYPGLNAIARAFNDRVSTSGCTIHYVEAGVDTGTIIAQQEVPIYDDDTLASLTERIHHAEHILYPAVIEKLLHPSSVP